MSLLTQFYNCDSGGGGGDTTTVAAGVSMSLSDLPVVAAVYGVPGTASLTPLGIYGTYRYYTYASGSVDMINTISSMKWYGENPSNIRLAFVKTFNLLDMSTATFNTGFTLSSSAGFGAVLATLKLGSFRSGGLISNSGGVTLNVPVTNLDSSSFTLQPASPTLYFRLFATSGGMTADSINSFLVKVGSEWAAVSAGGTTLNTGTINLTGPGNIGTSSLSAAATAAVTALTAAGWTIILNP